jgi:tRNA pseudouridine55 synthase
MEAYNTLSAEAFLQGQVLLIDKPLHWTSFQVVNKIRWILKKKYQLKKFKIGHAGTLDPLATGLLILCTGKMTKQIETFQGQEKTYTGRFLLGATTPSFDLETPIDKTFDLTDINPEKVVATTKQFIGTIAQQPPIFSALKKDGERLYERARRGEQIDVPLRKVTINTFEVDTTNFPEISFSVSCSKGTYIRSLVHDFGKALQNGAHLTQLRRTAIGDYTVANAISVTEFEAQFT